MSIGVVSSPSGHSVCCTRSALHDESGYCGECGKVLIRCMASAECGALLDDMGLCPVCVQPKFTLDAGAATSVKAGEKLALPLTITNASSVGRPLFINKLWMRGEDGESTEIQLPFQRLESGASSSVGIRTGRLMDAGVHRVDLEVAVSTRYQWREEQYVFSSAIFFPVESNDPAGPATVLNVHAETIGQGFTLYNPTRIEQQREAGDTSHLEPITLDMSRADMFEKERRRRGYDDGKHVPRKVQFEWIGFGDGHAPMDGPILRPSGLLSFGRNAISQEPGGNDVRLLVEADGAVHQSATLSISRQHFTVYTENGRLMLRADSQFGLKVNDHTLARTKTTVLNDGDVIRPLRKSPAALAIKVTFEFHGDEAEKVIFTRSSPA